MEWKCWPDRADPQAHCDPPRTASDFSGLILNSSLRRRTEVHFDPGEASNRDERLALPFRLQLDQSNVGEKHDVCVDMQRLPS